MMTGASVNGYSDLITTVAKRGFTIVTCLDLADVKASQAADWVEKTVSGAQSSGLVKNTDFTRQGIFGHSMGGGAVLNGMANCKSCNFLAGVAMHPWMKIAPGKRCVVKTLLDYLLTKRAFALLDQVTSQHELRRPSCF